MRHPGAIGSGAAGTNIRGIVVGVLCGVMVFTSADAGPGRIRRDPAVTAPAAASGLDARVIPIVDAVMQSMAVPAAVVQVRTATSTWSHAFGSRELGGADPIGVGDFFRVGSVTKTMVGTVLLQLVDEGRLRLDDPVSRFRDDVPDGDTITIAQLLNMRSGLFSYNEDPAFARTLDRDPGRVWQPEELLRIAWRGTPYAEPDSGFRYSNTNTILAALIIEQVTGNSIATELSQRVFRPLGLTRTSFPAPGDATIPAPSPHGYLYGSNVSALASPRLPEDQLRAVRDGTLLPADVTGLNPTWIWAAGAVISTAADLATYVRALVGGTTLLDARLQQARLDSAAPLDPLDPTANRYGLALESFGPMLGHDGAIPGFQTFMGYDPVRDVTIVVLCTVRDGPAGGRPANEIAYGIVRALYHLR
ncbi:serine hydrolase domain-containing protein [Nocardia sp. alder85J]|uniref:serine hydrolase domain-containing protein n=1 Tax=Nocardia sp. alder85J TaxID=2862949 RepID=UPI001CD75EF1|nr:serine hydrolase domain-containing protein [Nocardia sp. alder85J]MCX4094633.1 serine hydrolase [Nocardia sp. alder85J]